jgi:hypothetical protein
MRAGAPHIRKDERSLLRRLLALVPLAAILTIATATFAPAALADMDGPTGIALLNKMRVANGIPTVTESPSLSAGCANHDIYMSFNGLGDSEREGMRGYTADGAYAAVRSSTAHGASGWGAKSPWDQAPFHLAWILTPSAQAAGFYQKLGYSCLALDSYQQSSTNQIYTYPGDGVTGVDPGWITAGESPSPNKAVGLDRGKTTGTNLVIMIDGPWREGSNQPRIVSASLAPADGSGSPSDLRLIQGDTCMNDCAIVVPVDPLRVGTRYHASATIESGGVRLDKEWFFTTADTAQQPPPPAGSGAITMLSLSAHVFRASQTGAVKVTYNASASSFFAMQILRSDPNGVLSAGQCYSPAHRSGMPSAPKCPYWLTVRKKSGRTTDGVHATALSALLGPVKLKPGSYRLVLRGDVGSKTAAFTVQP